MGLGLRAGGLGFEGLKESATIRLRVPDIRHPQRKVFLLLPRTSKPWTGTTSWCGVWAACGLKAIQSMENQQYLLPPPMRPLLLVCGLWALLYTQLLHGKPW